MSGVVYPKKGVSIFRGGALPYDPLALFYFNFIMFL